jgi:hypothetical protein
MTTVWDIAAQLKANPVVSEEFLEFWIAQSDVANAKSFYGSDKDRAKQAVGEISTLFVETYLNNSNVSEVPLRRKTKFCLVLNNFALHKPVRGTVFNAIKNLSSIFEESMKKEGTMPFDSELGRMSEHVLVLLMRCCQYKFKAAMVHEFAENNTQFAVQLLLAILLKEPPYEFELRVNCICGLLGFTQPQAFFSADQSVEVHSCEGFTAKIDFTQNLMLRLQAVQVVNDVLAPQLLESATSGGGIVNLAITSMMRCIMNIFQFCSQGGTQWRQHLLLSTTFVDSVTVLFLQSQVNALQSLLAVAAGQANIALPQDMLPGIAIALKFASFATFHMGRTGRTVRPLCTFIYELLSITNVRVLAFHPTLGSQLLTVYTNMFHFMCNIDALAGDEEMDDDCEELIPELSSEFLRGRLDAFLRNEVQPLGVQVLEQWHAKFFSVDVDALISQDNASFQFIDGVFQQLKQSAATAVAVAAPVAACVERPVGNKHLADMPSLSKRAEEKKVAANSAAVYTAPPDQRVAVAKVQYGAPQVANRLACALSGNTMKCPVISPYGHNYEKDVIEQWIKQQGSVCPLTGNPLSLEELKPNKALQSEIMQTMIQQSMSSFNQEDAADLYDF